MTLIRTIAIQLVVAATVFSTTSAQSTKPALRTKLFSSVNGEFAIEGAFAGMDPRTPANALIIRKDNGKQISVPFVRFSRGDQMYIALSAIEKLHKGNKFTTQRELANEIVAALSANDLVRFRKCFHLPEDMSYIIQWMPLPADEKAAELKDSESGSESYLAGIYEVFGNLVRAADQEGVVLDPATITYVKVEPSEMMPHFASDGMIIYLGDPSGKMFELSAIMLQNDPRRGWLIGDPGVSLLPMEVMEGEVVSQPKPNFAGLKNVAVHELQNGEIKLHLPNVGTVKTEANDDDREQVQQFRVYSDAHNLRLSVMAVVRPAGSTELSKAPDVRLAGLLMALRKTMETGGGKFVQELSAPSLQSENWPLKGMDFVVPRSFSAPALKHRIVVSFNGRCELVATVGYDPRIATGFEFEMFSAMASSIRKTQRDLESYVD